MTKCKVWEPYFVPCVAKFMPSTAKYESDNEPFLDLFI